MGERSEKKVLSVRGVDEVTYREFVATAKELGKTVGQALTEAMRLYLLFAKSASTALSSLANNINALKKLTKNALSAASEGFREVIPETISNIDELEVGKADLEALGKRVTFNNIKRLIFREDVDRETFEKYVVSISNIDELVIPSTLPRLLVLARCCNVKKLAVR
ncbi:MAG: hypothetical protein DRJ40_01070 [Thermoprotei archaeon]|nr:MAG: hypothetical protein DRJ40_01070 [Thermoprotei archaeon]